MKSLFPILGLILAAAMAFGAGCADDSALFGVGGKKASGDSQASPNPTASPSGTGGSIIND